jgi:predicted DCC family thiol-disulfide oxidoreductase YuxK
LTLDTKTIIYFDGVCNLCNGFVDFLIPRIHREQMKIASLQGQTAKENLPQGLREEMGSVIVQSQGELYTHSQAVIYIFKNMKKPWPLLGSVLSILPTVIINSLYRFIANRRYQLFGKLEVCRLPSEKERQYFLP